MTTREAAQYLKISMAYLRNLRHGIHNHDGPICTEGRSARGKTWYYTKENLDLWLKNHKWRKDK